MQAQRSQELQEFSIWTGSPVGLDCARAGNKQLGDFFQEGLHICYGREFQVLNQMEIELISKQVNIMLYTVFDKNSTFPYTATPVATPDFGLKYAF